MKLEKTGNSIAWYLRYQDCFPIEIFGCGDFQGWLRKPLDASSEKDAEARALEFWEAIKNSKHPSSHKDYPKTPHLVSIEGDQSSDDTDKEGTISYRYSQRPLRI